MFDLAEKHGDPDLIALKDQDVVQILLDTIYLRVKLQSNEQIIGRIGQLAENTSPLTTQPSNLGNLTKSKNQADFVEKYLCSHLAFIEAAKMP